MQATYENPNLALGVKEFVEEVKYNRSFPEDTYEAARAVLSKIQAGQSFKDDVSRNDYDVPVNGKRFVPVRIVRRTELEDALPVIFYVHGGGWVLGDAMVYDRLLRKLAKGSYGAVVFVDYTHAPEVRFPTQLEELWAVLTHMLNNPGMYRINPYKLVMAGDGTGAAMAAVLAGYAQKEGINVDYQLLLYPSLDANLTMDSYRLFEFGPWMTQNTMQWFWETYLPDIGMRNQNMVSPLMIPSENLKILPETLIITAENDVTRDDGETFARKLVEAGVDAVSVRVNGTIHDFLMLEPLAHTTPTRLAFRLINGTLRQILWNDETYNGTKKETEE
ncbi:MAG: alpha/beta hydrolase [Alphaproteobacteria bacterium]|nr:alpha/beta hydrolase [Alphaproteobacteria bacterium]MBQ3116787.1 alpha/beta hydrolase [Alphaproteobacteria bacterium]MBQ6854130.1 alpha/beta hydrolase [Alphaproteobacteria bacterium]MBQ8558303.1 alpha/beta hydrolase [Alphaproteobacteria bacterium]MBR3912934.1 alpha/beta hydrolase [Alphaproteobacteria bacterium]